jgi:CTP synthase (UTP-ammonia lyase)
MDTRERIQALFDKVDPQTKKVISRVFEIEREKLLMGKPVGVVEDITKAIKEVVTE